MIPNAFAETKIVNFRRLGSGSYSTVHVCHLDDGSNIAVKRPGPTILEYMHTILREGLLLQKRYGPNPSGLFVLNDGTFFGIGMDLGICTLSKLRDSGPIQPSQMIHITRDILSDLHKLHSANIVHGDLKLANVIVFKDNCRICDFGLSSWSSDRGSHPFTTDDEMYTINYRPPELNQKQMFVTQYSDIWALGITLFGMIENDSICCLSDKNEISQFIATKFSDDYVTRFKSIKSILHTNVKVLPEENIFADAFCTLIAKCLNRTSALRPTAKDLLDLLKDFEIKPFSIEIKTLSPFKTYDLSCKMVTAKPIVLQSLTEFGESSVLLNAKNLLQLIKVEPNEIMNASIVHLSKILQSVMPVWRTNVCATLSTALCVMCVRPTYILQPIWCARFINTSVADYENKLGIALTIAILYPDWSDVIFAPKA